MAVRTPAFDPAVLREHLTGEVITPDDVRYDDARRVWNGMIDRYPALIARCLDADDVAVSRFGSRTVASALLAMCTPPPGRAADVGDLSFTGSGAAGRIRRLLGNEAGTSRLRAAPRALLT